MSAIPARLDRSAADKTSPDQWGRLVAEGRAARAQADGGRWRIGHLAEAVERKYRSAALQRYAEDIGESYSTVRRYRWVVKRYEPGIRFRFPGLSFSHFQAVAGVPGRVAWLERAELGAWSVDRLTRESRGGEASPAGPTAVARLRGSIGGAVRSLEQIEAVDDATLAAAGSEWLLETLEQLAERVESVQARLAAASKAKTTSLNRHKVTGRSKTRGAARAAEPSKPRASAKRIPVNPF